MALKTKSTGIDKITKAINTHCITYSENRVNHKEKSCSWEIRICLLKFIRSTNGSRTPAGDSWRCCSRSDTGACLSAARGPSARPSPRGAAALSPGLLQLHLRAHPAGTAPGGAQHAHTLHHRSQRRLPGRGPGAGEACSGPALLLRAGPTPGPAEWPVVPDLSLPLLHSWT